MRLWSVAFGLILMACAPAFSQKTGPRKNATNASSETRTPPLGTVSASKAKKETTGINTHSQKKETEELPDDLQSSAKTLDRELRKLREQVQHRTDMHVVAGQIDKGFLDRVLNLSLDGDEKKIILSSPGGSANMALRAARIIDESAHSLTIVSKCFSACAEYLLAASDKIRFLNKPLIGFHGNPIGNAAIVRQTAGPNITPCLPDPNHIENVRALYQKRNLNTDFWKEEYKRLRIINVTLRDIHPKMDEAAKRYMAWGVDVSPVFKDCKIARIKTLHTAWFPTSEQLRTLLGLKFTGAVCADDPKCYKLKINKMFGQMGESFIVGDEVYYIGQPEADTP